MTVVGAAHRAAEEHESAVILTGCARPAPRTKEASPGRTQPRPGGASLQRSEFIEWWKQRRRPTC